jgi:parallel beta-helix repeat protein
MTTMPDVPTDPADRSDSVTASSVRVISSTCGHALALLGIVLLGSGAIPPAAYAAGQIRAVIAPPGAVLLTPSMSIQATVDAHRSGTTYFLAAGIYRTQQVVPKNGDRFIGASGAQLNGARLLKGATRLGSSYAFNNQAPVPNAWRHGVCQAGFPRCDHPQALFLDDRPLRAVDRLTDLTPGTWFFDYAAKRIHMATNPAGRTVELTHSPYAFGGTARNVQIENLIVEKYASANQRGAINDGGGGTNWTIVNNEVRQNYGYGITLAAGHRASNNYVHDNGQLGIGGGTSAGILVEGNEIAYNAWNGTDCSWECGGAKWGAVSDIVIRGNFVHDNGGTGLWTDESCRNVLYEGNRIEGNAGAGISHEISFKAVIRNNTLRGNGAARFRWGWSAQIVIQNSSDTEVYGNRVELDPVRGGNGIVLIQQDRGLGFSVRNAFVHDNDIIMRGGHGSVAGWFVDFEADRFPHGNNRFQQNRYFVYSLTPDNDAWFANAPGSFLTWQAMGADNAGSVTTDLP